jgi:hypothetical protein
VQVRFFPEISLAYPQVPQVTPLVHIGHLQVLTLVIMLFPPDNKLIVNAIAFDLRAFAKFLDRFLASVRKDFPLYPVLLTSFVLLELSP